MKNKIAICLMLIFAGVSMLITGCSVFSSTGSKLTASTESITIRLDEPRADGGEINTANFVISVDNFDNSHISFRIENEGVITYTYERGYDEYRVKVKGVKAGQAKLVAFLAEDSSVYKEITVNVIRPIKDLELKPNYVHYVAMGQKNAIKASECFIVTPVDGDLSEVTYSIVSNQSNIDLQVDEKTGVIDATNTTTSGEIVVRAQVSDSIYTDIPVSIVKAVTPDTLSIARRYSSETTGVAVYNYGEQIYTTLSMVKTIEYYSETIFEIFYDNSLLNQSLEVVLNGDSITAQKLTEDKVVVKAVGLGRSTLTFKFSILGAEDFIEPTIIDFVINVIETPYDINLNGQSAKACNGVFGKAIYNRYANDDYGMSFRFTLSPSSVLEENADVIIDFKDPQKVKDSILVLDSNGNKLGYDESGVNFTGVFRILAGETFYVRSTLSQITEPTTYTFTATSDITTAYDKGELVSCEVNLSVYEGITELTTANSKYYIAQGDEDGTNLILGTGNIYGNTSQLTYEVENDNIRVEKLTSTNYVVYGEKIGESSVTFDSGNGHRLKVNFIVYGALTSAVIKTQTQFENGYIGEVQYDNKQSLSYISAKVKGGFLLDIKTNKNASVGKVKFEVDNAGKGYVSISDNYVSILGAGRATVTAYIYGYDEFGIVDDSEFSNVDVVGAIKRTFVVEGYVPISQIYLNYTSKELKDRNTVGFNSIGRDSQVKLKVTAYPSNATVNEDDIVWQVLGDYGFISNTSGFETLFTAGPITNEDVNTAVVNVVAYVKDRGRTYDAQCTITINKAVLVDDIKFTNVFNNEIYFDARDGLALYDDGVLVESTSNTLDIIANTYPTNAYNKKIRYIYEGEYVNNKPVFVVSENGSVQPVRGGEAVLKVVPDDSYIDDSTYRKSSSNLPRYIKVVVADGSSKETAYRISSATDLISIGTNANSMNLYYVLANDIDLSSYTNWQPIGGDTLSFTGNLSGRYNVGYNNIEVKSKITGLNFNTVCEGDKDVYLGLFGSINLGTISELDIECGTINIDATNLNGDLYFGALAGLVEKDFNDSKLDRLVSLSNLETSIINCTASSKNSINIKLSKKANYIGGLVGCVENGIEEISLSSKGSTIDFNNFVIEDNSNDDEIDENDKIIYIGGFVGVVKSRLSLDAYTSGLVKSITKTSIKGGYNLAANVDGEGNIIYSTYFKNSGLDVVINNMQISSKRTSYIGGFVGYAQAEAKNAGTISNSILTAEDFNSFIISNIGVYANITALDSKNVGGVVGCNEYVLSDVYFKGSIKANQNVGGIAGQNKHMVDKSIVNNGDGETISGKTNVGGVVGYQDDSTQFSYFIDERTTKTISLKPQLLFSYISSSSNDLIVDKIADDYSNIGTLVGFNGSTAEIVGCYSEIKCVDNIIVGAGAGAVKFSFIIGGLLNGTSTNSYYYIDEGSSNYSTDLVDAEWVDNEISVKIFVKPGSTITVNGKQIALDAGINKGMAIICRPNELPMYNVIYDTMQVTVKNSSDKFIKVSNDKLIVYYYELDDEFENSLTSKVKYELRQFANSLNVIDINEILDVKVTPNPFTSVRFNVSARNANGKGSPIITVNNDGTLTINREGLVILTITSVSNPNLSASVQIYAQRYVSALKLYNGTNASGIELDNKAVISIRKDYERNVFATILSEMDNIVFEKSENLGLHIVMNIKDNNHAYTDEGTLIDLSQIQINYQSLIARCYIEIGGVKHYATYTNGNLIFDEQNLDVEVIANDSIFKVLYNGYNYNVIIEQAYLDIDSVSTMTLSALKAFSSSFVVQPYILAEFVNGENVIERQKIYLTTDKINSKAFGFSIYEGAINIEADIDSVLYSPSDTVNFEVYVLSDSMQDGLDYVVDNQNTTINGVNYLNVNMYKTGITQLSDGKYKIMYNLSVNLANEFEARYLEENIEYAITFTSLLISEMKKTIHIQFSPQNIQRLDIVNYTNGEMMLSSDGESVELTYNPNEASSLYIASNASGMININMYPYYSKVDMVTIESVAVDNQTISFTQLIKDTSSINGEYTARNVPRAQYLNNGNVMVLQKLSIIDSNRNRVFNGNFYVRTLISSEVKEGTQMPVIVCAYNYDENGELVLVKQNTIYLIVKEIPFIKVELDGAEYSNYVVKGTTTKLKVTVGKTLVGQPYEATVSILNNNGESYASTSNETFGDELTSVKYTKSNRYTMVSGREVYVDDLYVGLGLSLGTNIVVRLMINYDENGESRSVVSDLTLVVIDFLIDDVDIYSFNNETNFLRLNQLQEYEFGVKKLYFDCAPDFENAVNEYSFLNENSVEFDYYRYYYGYLTTANDETYYLKKDVSRDRYYFYGVTDNGTSYKYEKDGKVCYFNFIYNKDSNSYNMYLITSSKNEQKTIVDVFGEGCSFVMGIEPKMRKLEEQIRYDVSLFTQKIANGAFESININDVTNSSKFYVKADNDGANYLVGIVVGSNYQVKFTLNYAYRQVTTENTQSGGNGTDRITTTEFVFNSLQMPDSFMQVEKVYTFNVVTYSDINVPLPIYTQADFESMIEGEHYILMNDITLVSYKPIDASIASLDGNNHEIILQSFDVNGVSMGSSVNLGLFDTIREGTIIKNVKVVIGGLKTIDVTGYSNVNIGFLAVQNNGIITNCYVSYEGVSDTTTISSSVINDMSIELVGSTLEIKSSNYVNSVETELNIAGLVITNSGSITNSRVGSCETYETTNNASVFDGQLFIQIKAKGNMAGFAMTNSGHISSSYVGNLYLINSNPSVTNSITAGFVGKNTGTIAQSYIKGLIDPYSDDEVNGTRAPLSQRDEYYYRSKFGAIISNGNIGGFIYENVGTITDCYSNIKISSNARTAGFVFQNDEKATIKTSYSASKVLNNSAVHMPFIGVGANATVLNDGVIDDCYYLVVRNEVFEDVGLSGLVAVNGSKDASSNVSQRTFNDAESFNGFSFGVTDKFKSIWEIQNYGPELVAPNQISTSIRFVNENVDDLQYSYDPRYILGMESNPYLISSAEEFNYYFSNDDGITGSNLTIQGKYYRIINNIDFNDVAGDNMTKDLILSKVSIEGNGFTLSNIRINSNANENAITNIGLFNTIKDSAVKNINLKIAEANALNVNIMGGLAGVISDSFVLNINIATNTVMQAYNVVGGLAGMIEGESYVHSITSSASVQAVYKSSDSNIKPVLFDKENNIATISYAGAVAGIIDLTTTVPLEHFKQETGVLANVKYIKVAGDASISAEFAGGLFGFVGAKTHIYDASFELAFNDNENLQQINSTYCVGVIAAVNYGIINHATVEHGIVEQAQIESDRKAYLTNGQSGNVGKINLLKGRIYYAGGIIGINYGGELIYSYSKVDLIDPSINDDLDYVTEQYFGGLCGVTYSGTFISCYASGNVVTKASNSSYAGGLIGRINYLSGHVNESSIENQQSSGYTAERIPMIFRELYALNYFDYGFAKYAFRTINPLNPDSVNTGVFFGYVADLSLAEEKEFSKLYAIANINFNGNLLFKEADIANTTGKYSRKIVALNLNSGSSFIEQADVDDVVTLNDIYSLTPDVILNVDKFFENLIVRGDFWSKEDGKLPILKFDNVAEEVRIFTAEQLVNTINIYPYKTFLIMNDLDFKNIGKVNYPTYPTTEFTGKIISSRFDNEGNVLSTNFYNLDYTSMIDKAGTEDIKNVGFIKEMKRATITDINFYIKGVSKENVALDSFGSIAGTAEGCNFTNVHVICVDGMVDKNNANSLTIGTIKLNAKKLGGLVAQGGGTNVLTNCSFTGNIENVYVRSGNSSSVNVGNSGNESSSTTEMEDNDVYIGGLFGSSNGLKVYNNSTCGYISFKTNMQFGTYINHANSNDYAFNKDADVNINALPTGELSIVARFPNEENDNAIKDALSRITLHLGGITGKNGDLFKITNAYVGGNNSNIDIIAEDYIGSKEVGGVVGNALNNVNIQSAKVCANISVKNGNKLMVGGIAGSISNAFLTAIQTGDFNNLSNITAYATRGENSLAAIGGLIGYAQNTTINNKNMQNLFMVSGNYAYTFASIKGDANNKLSIGGAIGEYFNPTVNSSSYLIYTYGSISTMDTTQSTSAQIICAGGIIGNNVIELSGNDGVAKSAYLINCYGGMDIDVNVVGAYNAGANAYVGGILGNGLTVVNNTNGDVSEVGNSYTNGVLSINNSIASGTITANYSENSNIFAGGVAGKMTNTKNSIKDVTILTHIMKSSYANSRKNAFIMGAVTSGDGQCDEQQKTGTQNGSGFIVDELTGLKIDTGALICTDTMESFAGSDYESMSYAEFLAKLAEGKTYNYVIRFYDIIGVSGSVLNPIRVEQASDIDLTKYNIIVSNELTVNDTLGDLSGVLAGGYLDNDGELVVSTINVSTKTLFNKVKSTAIISNIAITNLNLENEDTWTLNDSTTYCENALLALENYGIVKDIYATGYVNGTNVGGLVRLNSGLIYDSITDVNVTGIGSLGELASSTTRGTILNTFTLGEITSISGTTYVGVVSGMSEDSLYKYVNSATSVNTDLTKSVVGFVGTHDENDLFVYCTFDPQTVTRNSIELNSNNKQLRAFNATTTDTNTKATTSTGRFILLNSVTNTNNNYYYPYFSQFENVIKTTNRYDKNNKLTSARINNFTVLYMVLHNSNNIGETINLDYDINQNGFDVWCYSKLTNNVIVTKKDWKAVNYAGSFNGNDKTIKGISITATSINTNGTNNNYTGFFATLGDSRNTSWGVYDTSVKDLTLIVEAFESKLANSKSFNNPTNLDKENDYAGILAGTIEQAWSHNIVLDNVTVGTINSIQISGNMVGAFAGYAEKVALTSCKVQNIKTKAYNLYFFGYKETSGVNEYYVLSKWAYAGGFIGYAVSSTFTNCNNYNVVVTSDDGFDGRSIKDNAYRCDSYTINNNYNCVNPTLIAYNKTSSSTTFTDNSAITKDAYIEQLLNTAQEAGVLDYNADEQLKQDIVDRIYNEQYGELTQEQYNALSDEQKAEVDARKAQIMENEFPRPATNATAAEIEALKAAEREKLNAEIIRRKQAELDDYMDSSETNSEINRRTIADADDKGSKPELTMLKSENGKEEVDIMDEIVKIINEMPGIEESVKNAKFAVLKVQVINNLVQNDLTEYMDSQTVKDNIDNIVIGYCADEYNITLTAEKLYIYYKLASTNTNITNQVRNAKIAELSEQYEGSGKTKEQIMALIQNDLDAYMALESTQHQIIDATFDACSEELSPILNSSMPTISYEAKAGIISMAHDLNNKKEDVTSEVRNLKSNELYTLYNSDEKKVEVDALTQNALESYMATNGYGNDIKAKTIEVCVDEFTTLKGSSALTFDTIYASVKKIIIARDYYKEQVKGEKINALISETRAELVSVERAKMKAEYESMLEGFEGTSNSTVTNTTITNEFLPGTYAPPIGGYVAYANGCTFTRNSNTGVTLTSGHAGNGEDAWSDDSHNSGNPSPDSNNNGYTGYDGANGGNAYVGGYAGIAHNTIFSENGTDGVTYTFHSDDAHATIAGTGGNASDGIKSEHNCYKDYVEFFNQEHTHIAEDGRCNIVGNGGDGGNGGNAGFAFVGHLYGATDIFADYTSAKNAYKASGTITNFDCALGGKGGRGGMGGEGNEYSLDDTAVDVFNGIAQAQSIPGTDIPITPIGWMAKGASAAVGLLGKVAKAFGNSNEETQKFIFTHYGGDSGLPGHPGLNGNGRACAEYRGVSYKESSWHDFYTYFGRDYAKHKAGATSPAGPTGISDSITDTDGEKTYFQN